MQIDTVVQSAVQEATLERLHVPTVRELRVHTTDQSALRGPVSGRRAGERQYKVAIQCVRVERNRMKLLEF